jgi:glutamyl/glutaminyl-tRNA synthetase
MTCRVILRKMGGVMQRQTSRRSTHLEEAIALLIQTQAAFVAQLAESRRDQAESRRENDKTFAEINKKFTHIEAMLMRHERMLTDLPEVIRQKIDFQPS